MKLKDGCSLEESYDKPRYHVKKQDITLPTKVHLVKAMFFFLFPVVMYGCESWTIKKVKHQRIMLLNCDSEEDSWELLGLEGLGLDWIDQISQSWRKSVLNIHYKDWCCSSNTLTTWCKVPTHWKRPWCRQRLKAKKRAAEDEMVRWHYWLSGHESEQAPRDSRGQRSLACSSSWGHKELDTAKQLNTHTHTHTYIFTFVKRCHQLIIQVFLSTSKSR